MATTQSYVDYDALLSPDFTPQAYANRLVHQTNNANDTPIDLATPLSRVLFDAQEVDTHIDTISTQHALPLVEYTRVRADAGQHVLTEVESQVNTLSESYERLAREVGERYEAAAQMQLAAERLVKTVRLGRAVQRALALGRQLQSQTEELSSPGGHRAMASASSTVLGLRQLFSATGKGQEAEGLGRVLVVTTLRNEIVAPAERTLLNRAQQTVREFSMSSLVASTSGSTFRETEETKNRATHALQALYLLSPTRPGMTSATFEPTLMVQALQSYLQTALTSSLAALTRALATLPTLERTLLEISARCQNIVALEALLESTKAPQHPQLPSTDDQQSFLRPLLRHLDTASLPSYFWRSMAGQMSNRVHEILARGGVSARTLRTNKDKVKDAVRECVDRGSQLPVSGSVLGKKDGKVGNWEREAAVMVGSIMGPLQR
ncbi:hypothetical protein AMS68_006048 [Peltaster fructicola]|uniref:Conserved oligomeric Golgi complex subunit 5 n=1 Tax=Peltaster fructicola TaxID=286661 RepID=A0A6H0Y0T3_9PEZI|nr:hypothetical protein AMS68_006048 [Peltaster fructicola]